MRPLIFLACFAACAGPANRAAPPAAHPAPPADALAECLKEKGATLYVASWCKPCHDQLAALTADERAAIAVVDCFPNDYLDGPPADGTSMNLDRDGLTETPECETLKFSNFPTWVMADGTRHEGAYPPEFLGPALGCPPP